MVSLLLVSNPIFKTTPVARCRVAEPFTNLLQTTHVILKLREIVIVASVRPHVRASYTSFLTFPATSIEVDDYRSVVYREHDVGRIDAVVDDAEGMEVSSSVFDFLKTP